MADFKPYKGDFSIARIKKTGNYFAATLHLGVALTTQSISSINSCRAFPFYVPKTMRFDRIAIRVTTAGGAGAVARLGIYADNGNCYPGARILDAGEMSMEGTPPFIREATIDVTLRGGKLYWLVVLTGGATGTAVTAIPNTSVISVEGFDATLTGTPSLGYAVAQTYGSLPATYPGGATGWTLNIPAIFLRKAS